MTAGAFAALSLIGVGKYYTAGDTVALRIIAIDATGQTVTSVDNVTATVRVQATGGVSPFLASYAVTLLQGEATLSMASPLVSTRHL